MSAALVRLVLARALLLVNGVTLIAINGLAGLALAPERWLATLPVSVYVVEAALSTLPASFLMRRCGRRAGFVLGGFCGIAGASVCALAVLLGNFWLLCAGTMISGVYNAFGQYYRFAAADAASTGHKPRAISWVLAGGILGGVVGPATATMTRELWGPTFFTSYASLDLFGVVALLVVGGLRLPQNVAGTAAGQGRALSIIVRQPVFVVAVIAAAIGYGVMNLLMSATPLAMDICRLPFAETAFVLEWHVIAMFAPSFVTGWLIGRWGVDKVLLSGALLLLLCLVVGVSGTALFHFWWALLLLGVAWNFLFIGGTSLPTQAYGPAERAQVQGINDLTVFSVQMAGSFASGAVVTGPGWTALNVLAAPLALVALSACAWLWMARRRTIAK